MTGYILYNPLAGDGSVLWMDAVEFLLSDEIRRVDVTKIKDYKAFFQGMARDDYVILSGGDGTLNRFVNATREIEIEQEILYFPNGTGNDFARDLGKPKESGPFPITEYLKDLPTVTVQKKEYRFVNGVGFGIDGYCCEKGDELRKRGKKRISYPAIAIRGLLGGFRPVTARVTVDGVSRVFTGVWLAPTMLGRYYGGGMMPSPTQDRKNADGTISVMVFHGKGRWGSLFLFPSLFSGKHVEHKNAVTVLHGHDILVEFDRPTPLQIDGETLRDVRSYRALSPVGARREAQKSAAFAKKGM